MPTRISRLPFILQSIKYFRAQTYQDAELMISCVSPEYPEELRRHIVYDENIVLRWTPENLESAGEARNHVNVQAHGQIIIHWDDDDWYAPERIADEVGFLISSGKQVVGYHDMLYFRESDKNFFRYRYQRSTNMPHYATGTSQCYWRDYWRRNQFKNLKIGEDSAFSIEASQQNVLTSKDSCGMLVARSHEGSTSKPSLGSSQFPQISKEEAPQAFLAEVGL